MNLHEISIYGIRMFTKELRCDSQRATEFHYLIIISISYRVILSRQNLVMSQYCEVVLILRCIFDQDNIAVLSHAPKQRLKSSFLASRMSSHKGTSFGTFRILSFSFKLCPFPNTIFFSNSERFRQNIFRRVQHANRGRLLSRTSGLFTFCACMYYNRWDHGQAFQKWAKGATTSR